MESQNTGGLIGVVGDSRKMWKDQSEKEKIESLKIAYGNISHLSRVISELREEVRKLKLHKHVDGIVVIPAEYISYEYSSASYNPLA